MALSFEIYVDTYSRKPVVSDLDPTPAPLPIFTQGDTFKPKIYFLARTRDYPLGNFSDPANPRPPYLIINNAALSLKAALGVKDGLAGSTLYTWQFTWSKAADTGKPERTYFTARFPMNTSGISDLIGSAQSAQAWFELELTEDGDPWTVLQENVSVQAEVIDTAVTGVVPPSLTPLSLEEARAIFLGRKIFGPIYLEDINNPGQFLALYNENGSLKADNVGGSLPI